MNRKQKVLTVIALIAFVLIGAGHYLAWPPLSLYGYRWVPYPPVWKELTFDEAEQHVPGLPHTGKPAQNLQVPDGTTLYQIFIIRLQEQGGYTDSEGQYHTYSEDDPDPRSSHEALAGIIPPDAKVWLPVRTGGTTERDWYPRIHGSLNSAPSDAMVSDVRLPFFMLGVIYAGLFFLLADRKEKR
jgi:hypothetical protein